MDSCRANGRRWTRLPSSDDDDDETTSVTGSYRATALRSGCLSDESLGARSLPGLDRSPSPERQTKRKGVPTGASMEAVITDVPLFHSSRHEFQHTLAIVKPEAARLMYKIETVFAKNGFIVIAVRIRFASTATPRGDGFFNDHIRHQYAENGGGVGRSGHEGTRARVSFENFFFFFFIKSSHLRNRLKTTTSSRVDDRNDVLDPPAPTTRHRRTLTSTMFLSRRRTCVACPGNRRRNSTANTRSSRTSRGW